MKENTVHMMKMTVNIATAVMKNTAATMNVTASVTTVMDTTKMVVPTLLDGKGKNKQWRDPLYQLACLTLTIMFTLLMQTDQQVNFMDSWESNFADIEDACNTHWTVNEAPRGMPVANMQNSRADKTPTIMMIVWTKHKIQRAGNYHVFHLTAANPMPWLAQNVW